MGINSHLYFFKLPSTWKPYLYSYTFIKLQQFEPKQLVREVETIWLWAQQAPRPEGQKARLPHYRVLPLSFIPSRCSCNPTRRHTLTKIQMSLPFLFLNKASWVCILLVPQPIFRLFVLLKALGWPPLGSWCLVPGLPINRRGKLRCLGSTLMQLIPDRW